MASEAKLVSKPKTRLDSLLDGLAAIWPASPGPRRYPYRDEAEALLRGGLRSGDDMQIVIERARGQATAK